MSTLMNMYSHHDKIKVTPEGDTIWIRDSRDAFSVSLQLEDIHAIREALKKIEEYINGQENR